MSLIVCVDDPAAPPDAADRHFLRPAGFESYRHKLWGTPAVFRRSPLLAQIETNLYVLPDQFSTFEAECASVATEADAIASELGWGEGGGDAIRGYMATFFEAAAFARQHHSDQITIW